MDAQIKEEEEQMDGKLYLWEGLKKIKPATFPSLTGVCVHSLSLGIHHGAILSHDGMVYTFGDNDTGQLGLGNCGPRIDEPVLVDQLKDITVVQVCCGERHTAVVTQDGGTYCWGDNSHYQCGVPDTSPITAPKPVPIMDTSPPCDHARTSESGEYLAKILQVGCGAMHTVVLSDSGDLWSWGSGRALGLLTKNQAQEPTLVPFLQSRRVLKVSCGGHHTVAVVESPAGVSAVGLDGKGRLKGVVEGVTDPEVKKPKVIAPRHRPATCVRCKEERQSHCDSPDACTICYKHTCPLGFQVKDRKLDHVKGHHKDQNSPQTVQTEKHLPKSSSNDSNDKQAKSNSSQKSKNRTNGFEIKEMKNQSASSSLDDPSQHPAVLEVEETSFTSANNYRKHRPENLMDINSDVDSSQSSQTSSPPFSIPVVQAAAPESPFLQKMGSFIQMVSSQPAAVQEYMTNITSSVVSNIKTSINKIGLTTGEEEEYMRRKLSPATEKLLMLGSLELGEEEEIGLQLNMPKSKSSHFGMKDVATPEHKRKSSLPHALDVVKKSDGLLGTQNEIVLDTEVWTWGDNQHGQLGHGDSLDRSQPSEVQALRNKSVLAVMTGTDHNIALTVSSQVYVWGRNDFGQLGHTKSTNSTPYCIKTLGGAAVWSAAAGDNHSLLLTDGTGCKPEIFYAGKIMSSEKTSSPDVVSQFTFLRTPWEDDLWLHNMAAGGSRCACVVDKDSSGITSLLHKFAATERVFHRQLLMIIKFISALRQSVASPGDKQLPQLLTLLHKSLTVLTNMVAMNHLELKAVITHDMRLKKMRLFHHCESLVSAFVHYSQCVGNLRIIRGLNLNKDLSTMCTEVLKELGCRSRIQGSPELDGQMLLELPFSRVTEYKELSEQLAQCFPAYWHEHYQLSQTSKAWELLKTSVKSERKLVDNTIAFWESMTAEYPDKLEKLRIGSRRLLKQGQMFINEPRKKDRTFALFNDILVYFKKSALRELALDTLWVEVVPDSKKLANGLTLTAPEETMTVVSPERGDWFCALSEAITNLINSRSRLLSGPPKRGSGFVMSVPVDRQAVYDFTEQAQYKGAKYEGCWRNGKPHGEGRLTWDDGRSFIGRFKQGCFEYGMYAVPKEKNTPELQIGHWRDWKLHGNGEIRYANGDEFKGHFLDGKRYGHGVFTEESTVYIGEWTTDKRNGYGVEVQSTEVYMGLWNEDQKHGGGVMVTLDDLYFEGNFSYNKMTGLGLLITEDGMCYEGQFSGGLFSLSGHGKITFPNGDYIEGRFQGTFTGGINVNGTLRKGQGDRESILYSLDDYKHDVEYRAVCFGKLGVPSDRKWADVFSECYALLGCGLDQKPGEVETERIWRSLVSALNDKAEVLDFLTQRELSQDSEGSKSRLSRRFGLVEELTSVPDEVSNTSPLTVESYAVIKDYLTKALDCPLHPLGKLTSDLIFAYTTTYDGRGLHPRLLYYAVEEVKGFVTRIYDLVRLLFPCLPALGCNLEPLVYRQKSTDTTDSISLKEEVYVTPECLLHPLLMPELYPTLFNLYALYHSKEDDAYWLRLERWNKKPDLAIMVYLGIESRYWRSDSMDFDAVDPDSPVWKFKGMNTFNNCYTQAVETLQEISTAYSPIEKLTVLRETFREITRSLGEGELLGQDFLFPIFTFVVLRAKIRQLGAEIHFIEDLMEHSLKTGELGHMITDLSATYHYIQNEDDRKSVSHHHMI